MSEENEEQMIPTPSDFGHFVLERELGHGGMGGVYLARDKMLDRKVAIKVMLKSLGADPAFVERFQREALGERPEDAAGDAAQVARGDGPPVPAVVARRRVVAAGVVF